MWGTRGLESPPSLVSCRVLDYGATDELVSFVTIVLVELVTVLVELMVVVVVIMVDIAEVHVM